MSCCSLGVVPLWLVPSYSFVLIHSLMGRNPIVSLWLSGSRPSFLRPLFWSDRQLLLLFLGLFSWFLFLTWALFFSRGNKRGPDKEENLTYQRNSLTDIRQNQFFRLIIAGTCRSGIFFTDRYTLVLCVVFDTRKKKKVASSGNFPLRAKVLRDRLATLRLMSRAKGRRKSSIAPCGTILSGHVVRCRFSQQYFFPRPASRHKYSCSLLPS